jgi:hypothetical protein
MIFLVSSALAQMTSDNYQIRTSVLTNGGGQKSSPNYGIQNSIGQPTPSGFSLSPNYGLYAGFQPMTLSEFPEWVPYIMCSTDMLDFGTVSLENLSNLVLTISNDGLGELVISSISTDVSEFACSHESMSIAGRSSADLTVTFTPVTADTFQATLTILCNDEDTPEAYVSLNGIGVEGCQGDIGDVNGDAAINVLDVLATVNEILGVVPLDEFGLCRADCKADGTINVLDALNIVNIILGIIPECPSDGQCKPIITPETIAFMKTLESYFPPEEFDRFMVLVKTAQVPTEYILGQNYPNPFNPTTDISYQIADGVHPVHTTLKIYNVLGQEVATLVDEPKAAGFYTVAWDASGLSSGVYFYRLTVDGGQWSETRRMVLMK